MPFITRINFQDNRQHVLPERKTHELSGITEFGLPFSALTYGPDMTTSANTSTLINVVSTFSGNTGTTVFTFGDARMNIADSTLSAITPLTSAITQDTGYVFIGNTSQVVDGNTVYLDYTGTSFDFSVTSISEPSAGIFTGTAISTDVFFFSAGTLDYLDRMIWAKVNGILQTNKLIVVDGAQTGYVLTALNNSGDTAWSPSVSGGTSYWSASTGLNAIVPINRGSVASGDYSISDGFNTTAFGNYSYAQGSATTANGYVSHAEGYLTTALGDYSHAEGYATRTTINAFYGHSEGRETLAKGDSSHAEGYKTTTDSTGAHAEGYLTIASGTGTHAEGLYSQALASGAHAEGFGTVASGTYSHAEGYDCRVTGDYAHVQGFNTEATGISSFASGSGTTASGHNSFIHSHNSTVSGKRSVVLGGSGVTATQDETVYVPNLVIWESYTPSGSTDTYGVIGQVTWDNSFGYIKTNTGWGRFTLNSF